MKKTRPKIAHYVVMKRGLTCALFVLLTGQRAGVLLPAPAGGQAFQRRARANAAIRRTEKCRERLHGSLHREWFAATKPQIAELLRPGELVVVPVMREPVVKP